MSIEETFPESGFQVDISEREAPSQLNKLLKSDGVHRMLEGKITIFRIWCFPLYVDLKTRLLATQSMGSLPEVSSLYFEPAFEMYVRRRSGRGNFS